MKRLLLFFAMLISLTLPFERLGGSFLQAQGQRPCFGWNDSGIHK